MKKVLGTLLVATGVFACFLQTSSGDLQYIPFQSQPFNLQEPSAFVRMVIPEDNPLTVEGVSLGRKLFFDPILSADYSRSCASCHKPALAFTDALPVGIGVRGASGKRSSPSLLNIGYHYKGLFWDGRSPTLEDQAFHPVRDKLEMALGWEEAVRRLQQHADYPELFRKAFGIKNIEQIDSLLAAKALAQFQRTLISSDAKFDRVKRGEAQFTDAEERGSHIFFDSSPESIPVSECVHCHADPLFTDLDFTNNGILSYEEQINATDKGRKAVTNRSSDLHKFRTPSLRNIAITAPYMHDGRFATLEEVIDHYISGGHFSENVNPNVRVLNLNDKDKADLIAFLQTLTDSTALNHPDYQNPFLQ